LVRSNEGMGKDYIIELTLPTDEEIRNARPLATVLPPGCPHPCHADCSDRPVATRLAKVANRLREFYGDGKRACLLDTLTLGGSPPAIQNHAKPLFPLFAANALVASSKASLVAASWR
jgi:hypothetical protein